MDDVDDVRGDSVEVIYVCSWQIWLEFCQKFGTSIRKYGTC